MVVTKEFFESGEPVANEVIELHSFFQEWFNGKSTQELERFTTVLADDFDLITPSSRRVDRDQIIQIIKNRYNTSESRKVWVERVTTKTVGTSVVATYYEFQKNNEEETQRISTAIFSFKKDAPNFCQWHQVHETWVND